MYKKCIKNYNLTSGNKINRAWQRKIGKSYEEKLTNKRACMLAILITNGYNEYVHAVAC